MLASLAPPVRAQTPVPTLAALAEFRDSLRAITNDSALRALERHVRTGPQTRHNEDITQLRLGFVQLRLGELEQNGSHFLAAEQLFSAVIQSHRTWSPAWLGRGLARLNLASGQVAPSGTVIGIFAGDHYADVAKDVAASATLDSTAGEGLLLLRNIAMQDYLPAHFRAALLAFRRVADKPVGRDFVIQIAHAQLERAGGNLDTASKLIAPLLQRDPRNPALLMEAGHIALSRGDDAGADSWLAGLALADAETARWYRSDLFLAISDSVLRKFDAAEGTARAVAIKSFLSVNDSGQARSAVGWLRELYRRLDHARTAYTLPAPRYRADAMVSFAPRFPDVDERGLVWILHGPPDDHTYLNMLGAPPNESWHYRDDGGELLFHFIMTDPTAGYHRVSSVFDILAFTKPLQATGHGDVKAMAARGEAVQTYGASWTAQTVQDMLYSREAMSPTYGRMLSRGKNGALELQAAERATGDSSIVRGETRTERYELPLDAQLDAIAVGSDGTGQLIQVAFAIHGSSLYASPTVRPVVYPVHMRVSVIRRGTAEIVASIDTLRNFVAAEPVPVDGVLFGRLPIRVPPGEYTVRMALETPGRGLMGPRLVVRVAGTTTPALDLSDLALGARSIKLPWRTPHGDSLWVNPSREFRNNEPMQVYFEVIGVTRGSTYQTSLAVFKVGDDKPQLNFAFANTAADSPDPIRREVDISRLKPGSYQLQVTISRQPGEQVVRRGEFTVVK